MPGQTPNRGYPYPVDTDPIDVAGDVQALAEAIDLDVVAQLPDVEVNSAAAPEAFKIKAASWVGVTNANGDVTVPYGGAPFVSTMAPTAVNGEAGVAYLVVPSGLGTGTGFPARIYDANGAPVVGISVRINYVSIGW